MLSDCNSNTTGRDIANAVGKTEVKYGVIATDTSGEKTKMGFGDPTTVSLPWKGMRVDT